MESYRANTAVYQATRLLCKRNSSFCAGTPGLVFTLAQSVNKAIIVKLLFVLCKSQYSGVKTRFYVCSQTPTCVQSEYGKFNYLLDGVKNTLFQNNRIRTGGA